MFSRRREGIPSLHPHLLSCSLSHISHPPHIFPELVAVSSVLLFDLEHTLLQVEPSLADLQVRARTILRRTLESMAAEHATWMLGEQFWLTPLTAFKEIFTYLHREIDSAALEELAHIESGAMSAKAWPVPGALEILDRYRDAGFGLGICAAGPAAWLCHAVREHQLDRFVHAVHLGMRCSPAELFMLASLVRKQVVGADNVVVIGHDPRYLSAGAMLGYRVIALGGMPTKHANAHIATLSDLPTYVPL